MTHLHIHQEVKHIMNNSITFNTSTCMQVPRFSFKEKTLGLEWGSNPQPHISSVMLYQLSYQAPWEQGGGEEGIQVLVLVRLSVPVTIRGPG